MWGIVYLLYYLCSFKAKLNYEILKWFSQIAIGILLFIKKTASIMYINIIAKTFINNIIGKIEL